MSDRANGKITGLPADAVAVRVHGALLAVQVMFASLPVAGKLVYASMDPLGVAAARTGGGAIAFWLAIVVTRSREPIRSRRDLGRLAIYALLGVVINQICFLVGLHYSTAVNASVLVSTIPVFTALLVIVLGHERARPARLTGIVLAFAGVAVVMGRFDLSSRLFLGNAMVVANAFSYSLFLVLSRPLLSVYSPLTVTAWIFTFGALCTVPLGASAFVEGASAFGWSEWGLLAFIVLVPTITAYFLNSWCLKRAPASLVAVYIYLQPVTAAVLAFFLLGEELRWHQAFGALGIFLGIWLAGRSR